MEKRIKSVKIKSILVPIFILPTLGTVILGMVINVFIHLDMPEILIGNHASNAFDRLLWIFYILSINLNRCLILGIIISLILLLLTAIYNLLSKIFGGISIIIDD